ncbi:MAG: Tellurite resistance protein TerB [Methanomassiliicoccales archaeon PtaB.Bin215]|nr:MAG: Tellurite resistance protein TerB [Methanomassiliicoccales archaeon PtaB.Bin215]
MGLFDKFSSKDEKVKLSKEEAFAAVSLVAIAADGVITEEEARGMFVQFYRMRTFAGYNDNQMSSMLNKLINIIKKQGLDALVGLAKESLPENMRATAFAVATDLALADGEIAEEEKRLLTKVQQSLGLPEDEAVKIIEVMMIKNKG